MEDIKQIYFELKQKKEIILARQKRNQMLVSMLRLLVFITGAVLSGLSFGFSVSAGIAAILVTLTLFLMLVKKFAELSEEIILTQNLISISEKEMNALDGDCSSFDGGAERIDQNHFFSGDLDLFGEDSLFRYLNRTVTGPGKSILADWLSDPYALREKITERQKAISELAFKLKWRLEFMAYGLDKPLNGDEIKSLSEWLNEKDHLFSSLFIRISSTVLPVAAAFLLILVISGTLPLILFLLVCFLNIFLIGIRLRKINRIHQMVSQKHEFLSSVEHLIKSIEKESFDSTVLLSLKERLTVGEGSVAARIRKLGNIIRFFDSRLNMIVGFILNSLFLWDFHCIIRLERWKKSAATNLPLWLSLLGEIDALNSLANYTYNNPGHSFPEIINEGPVIEASRLGHPLLSKDGRVDNDFSVPHRGRIFIITGANMAGKSTFLRTVAVNMILAMAGAPVCAEKMRFAPVRLFTSMRTTDSLSHNESYFYAELKRLKTLKERLEEKEDIFFILDEILKGTNSTDKSLGSKMFLRQLAGLGATGLIATHDISLGEMEAELPGIVVNKCFEIDIDGENISFDYILRDGITHKMNAAVLMKQMGIA